MSATTQPFAPGDLSLRGLGAVLLGLCAGLGGWLYRTQQAAPNPAGAIHYAAALAAALCWSIGWALLAEGSLLLRRVPRPRRTSFRQI